MRHKTETSEDSLECEDRGGVVALGRHLSRRCASACGACADGLARGAALERRGDDFTNALDIDWRRLTLLLG
eukprot:6156327-Pyramimonas_sp.AAC.1